MDNSKEKIDRLKKAYEDRNLETASKSLYAHYLLFDSFNIKPMVRAYQLNMDIRTYYTHRKKLVEQGYIVIHGKENIELVK